MTDAPGVLVAIALAAIAALVLLVVCLKVNPFIALFLVAISAGAASGKPMLGIVRAFQEGMGATLGSVAGVIALGAIFGKFLTESKAAEGLSREFIRWFGAKRVVWCVLALGFLVGLTAWFVVGLMLLTPIAQRLARDGNRPYLQLALPLLASLSAMHGLTPPHPGPVVAIAALHADTARALLWGVIIGIPAAIIAGPVFGRWASKWAPISLPVEAAPPTDLRRMPSATITLITLLLPIALMLFAWMTRELLVDGGLARLASFVGDPNVALLLSVIVAAWSLGTRSGYSRKELLKFSEEAVAGVGMAILVVGAGGGFARVLKEAGISDALGSYASAARLSPLVYGWVVAAFIRVATGSATVAITTAAGLVAPVIAMSPAVNVELVIVSIGCGSLVLSHLNDGGFWIVKECLGGSVRQTLQTWTVCETILGVTGLLLALAANSLL